VGRDDHAGVAADLSEQAPELDALLGIQPRRGFVEQEDLRVVHDGLSDSHASHHPARQGLHTAVGAIGKPDPVERAIDRRRDGATRHLLEPGEVLHELACRVARIKAEALRQVADEAAKLAQVAPVRVEAGQPQLVRMRPQDGGERLDERRLAGAVGPEQAVHAGVQIQVHAVDGEVAAGAHGQ